VGGVGRRPVDAASRRAERHLGPLLLPHPAQPSDDVRLGSLHDTPCLPRQRDGRGRRQRRPAVGVGRYDEGRAATTLVGGHAGYISRADVWEWRYFDEPPACEP
jgi:hypothetical protein